MPLYVCEQANYNRHLLRLVVDRPNTAVVAVSGNEVMLAASEGLGGERVIFNGNGKQRWELELAVDMGCLMNIDSLFDLHRLASIAADRKRTVRLMLRINPDIDAVSCAFPSSVIELYVFVYSTK
jgi:diaminopimelate decarboxylase